MLVLDRKPDEVVVITVPPSSEPRTIRVMNVAVRGDRCRIGFEADRDVTIHRAEVQAEIESEGTTG